MEIPKQWEKIKKDNFLRSDIVCFGKLVLDNKFTKDEIKKLFNKLVDKNDYSRNKKTKENLLIHFIRLNKATNKK